MSKCRTTRCPGGRERASASAVIASASDWRSVAGSAVVDRPAGAEHRIVAAVGDQAGELVR